MPSDEIKSLKQKLEAQRSKLWDAVHLLSPAQLEYAPPGEWSARDILAHIAFAESINVRFARLMLEQDRPAQVAALANEFPDYTAPFSLDGFNAYMHGKLSGQPHEQIAQQLERTRAETLAWLGTLTPEQLERSGEHAAWGETTVRGIIRILALHDQMHAQEIRNRVQRESDPGRAAL